MVPVLTSSLMSSSFMRMVTESSLIFCCAWSSPSSELPSKLFRLPTRDISSELELAADLRTHRLKLAGRTKGDRDKDSRFNSSHRTVANKHSFGLVLNSDFRRDFYCYNIMLNPTNLLGPTNSGVQTHSYTVKHVGPKTLTGFSGQTWVMLRFWKMSWEPAGSNPLW